MINVVFIIIWLIYYFYVIGLYFESYGIVLNSFWDFVYKENFIYDYDCLNYGLKFYNVFELIWLM